MMLTDKEIAKLSKSLYDYYMGELIPPHDAIRGYYDDGGDPTYYHNFRPCVECRVEYTHTEKRPYMGENLFTAHITLYVGNGQFFRCSEMWDAEDVRKFRNEIEITLAA